MSATQFYDVKLTYEDNYERGPFGDFAGLDKTPRSSKSYTGENTAQGSFDFFRQKVNTPFGIPAGPLLNEHFTTAAFRAGFDIATYKTVRSRAWGCNPFPNVLSVHPTSADGSLTANSPETIQGLLADTNFGEPSDISISNSFGVPSQDPDVWQPDMKKAIEQAGEGQLLLASFQGSRTADMTEEEYIADHVTAARLVVETGAKVLEMNTSCPNEGKGRLLCHNPELVGKITEAVKNEIGDIPLIIKLAYMADDQSVETMMRYTAVRQSVQGFATINTISAKLIDKNGNQALPGVGRETSGVCGAAIKKAGLDMVERVIRVQRSLGMNDKDCGVIAVGGVTSAADYVLYRQLGATAVMSATGAMWNAQLGEQVREIIAH
ncbi:diguanylate cyclase [Alloscardovia theropitheci]|uniref:Diguanylate cyclase n=1 Tax=Alloscardovia theropitheci TaxID=2496842 RepID=A0A4R0QQR7_9BIFI|nr:tRNA-dihydrouridine synthase [Alloscardovia theropitheci]TCD54672.1 diguanylate cyclase [Alloscardovia theropitheci]